MQKIILIVGAFIFSLAQPKAQQWDRQMELKSCSIDIKADQFTATTFIEMEFCNPHNQELEGLYRFELKPGQVITAFQLQLDGRYRDGSIEEKWKATNAYNSIVGKRIDPALLTMDYADHYSLRIYPVPAKGCRKVTVTIQQLLIPGNNGLQYFLPLNVKNEVQRFSLRITVNGNTTPVARTGLISDRLFTTSGEQHRFTWETDKIQLQSPVAFAIPLLSQTSVCTKITPQQTFFALRYQSSSPKEYSIQPKKLEIYWDASASLSKRDINKEINFLKQFISYHNISQLTIIPFNYKLLDTAVFYTENGFNSRWQQYIQNINYDGATQLGIIDLRNRDADMFLLFTDGSNTYGKSRPQTGTALVSCVNSSNTVNFASLQFITGAGGGKIVDLHKMSMSAAITTISRGENWLMNISSASGKVLTEQTLPLKQESNLFINGTMPAHTDTLYFHYGNNNRIRHTEKLVINPGKGCTESAIDRITMLASFGQIIHQYSWSNIVDFGLQEKVVTLNTAYIVLERVEDYVRYNITPPKELEAACERMNYVKRDTRLERQRLEAATTEFDIMNRVAVVFNDRVRRWDPAEKPVFLEKKDEFKQKTGDVAVNKPEAERSQDNAVLNGMISGVMSNSRDGELSEVVITGYATARKRDITGSMGYIGETNLLSSPTSIAQALQGRVAGLEVRSANNNPGSAASFRIRGVSSLTSNGQPLFVIDGIPVSGDINDLVTPNDIENIMVLKDPNAAAIFGSRATNGAIVITTKKGKSNYNYYNNKPYRLKDMPDVEYLQELKGAPVSEKLNVYGRLKDEYGGEAGFYFDVAQHLYESGLHKQALEILMNAAEAANGSQQVTIAMAYILEHWHRYEEAIDIYEQLIDDSPTILNLHSNLAWAHYQIGHYQEAVDILFNAIKTNTGQTESANLYVKSMLLNEMNAIIQMHKDKLDISHIPSTLIKSLPVDMRIVIDCNKGNMSNVRIKEPGGAICDYANPTTKNGGTVHHGYYWYYTNPFEYQVKKAPEGQYKISVNYYDSYFYPGKIPSVIRIRKFKNFGRENQSIEIENVIMDNQNGQVEIAEVKW